jgi:hypothetical protein
MTTAAALPIANGIADFIKIHDLPPFVESGIAETTYNGKCFSRTDQKCRAAASDGFHL